MLISNLSKLKNHKSLVTLKCKCDYVKTPNLVQRSSFSVSMRKVTDDFRLFTPIKMIYRKDIFSMRHLLIYIYILR